ncbi:MAG TPA: hypothetical protein VGC63_04855 [Solirubrobacterales bacterium]
MNAKRLVFGVRRLYRRYPARSNTLIVAGVVALAGAFGVAVDAATAKDIVVLEAPILLGGEATHHFVSPAKR